MLLGLAKSRVVRSNPLGHLIIGSNVLFSGIADDTQRLEIFSLRPAAEMHRPDVIANNVVRATADITRLRTYFSFDQNRNIPRAEFSRARHYLTPSPRCRAQTVLRTRLTPVKEYRLWTRHRTDVVNARLTSDSTLRRSVPERQDFSYDPTVDPAFRGEKFRMPIFTPPSTKMGAPGTRPRPVGQSVSLAYPVTS